MTRNRGPRSLLFLPLAFLVAGLQLTCVSLVGAQQGEARAAPKVTHRLEGHTDEVRSIDYTPDGKRLVSCSEDGTLRVWNALTGRPEKTHKVEADFVRVLGDGKSILVHQKAIVGSPRVFAVIDIDSGKQLVSLEDVPKNLETPYFRGVAALPGGRFFGFTTTELCFWKSPQAQPTKSWKFKERLEGTVLVVSPDGTRIATDNLVLWDVAKEKEIMSTSKVFTGGGRIVGFSHDSKRLAGVRVDGAAHAFLTLWDAASGEQIWETNVGFFGAESCAFSPDDKVIVVGGINLLKFYDSTDGKLLHELEAPHNWNDAVFSPVGGQLATATQKSEILLWDVSGYALAKAPVAVGTNPTPGVPPRLTKPAETKPAEPFRLWSSADGKFKVEARLRSASADKVQLERQDGRIVDVPRKSLSPADVRYVEDRKQHSLEERSK